MTHQEFLNQYLGSRIDFDSGFGYQCTDVVRAYVEWVWGKPTRIFGGNGGAVEAYRRFPDAIGQGGYAELIVNNPNDANQAPEQGDIVIYDATSGNQWGHIGIVDQAFPGQNRLISIDQNSGSGNGNGIGDNAIRRVTHTYTPSAGFGKVLGWIRLKKDQKPTGPVATNGTQYTVQHGGWRSQVIEEIIAAGIWSGTWQENLERFNGLNPITPSGGWQRGEIITIAEPKQEQPKTEPQPIEIPKPQEPTMPTEPIQQPESVPVTIKIPENIDAQIQHRREAYADQITNQIEKETGFVVEKEQVQTGAKWIANTLLTKLLSSRLWLAVGGTITISQTTKDTIILVASTIIIFGIYTLSETLIKLKNSKQGTKYGM